jgi:hypothetical protein
MNRKLPLTFLFILSAPGSNALATDPSFTTLRPDYRKHLDVSGYVNITEVTVASGLGNTTADYTGRFTGLTMVNGYAINEHFITGIGLGLQAYNGGSMGPVYLDIRYTLNSRKKYTPFIYGDGGMLLNFDDFSKPGLFISPGIGISRSIDKKIAVILSTAVFVQSFPKNVSSFIQVKLGIRFLKNGGEDCMFPEVRRH